MSMQNIIIKLKSKLNNKAAKLRESAYNNDVKANYIKFKFAQIIKNA
jgi:hypothetical protein